MNKKTGNLFWKKYIAILCMVALPCATLAAEVVSQDKSSRFRDSISETGATSSNASTSALAAKIREQRAKLDNQETAAIATASGIKDVNACDTGLRQCMQEKCGNDFSKCYSDSEAIWGTKMDACRRDTKCTAHEYTILTPEIKADRDLNVRLAEYQKIVDCGTEYNACIFQNCGTTMDDCLAKSDGDAVIEKCKAIADKCKEQDSGLASRAMDVFSNLRKIAADQVKADEKRLYDLRDKMEATCKGLGAMFDTRTLDCVYTVNFFADNAENPTASKKLYGGSVFQCTPEWFGIDVTTFKENAYRLTRSEAAASSAALGAGLGTAGGMLASGQIQNAIDTGGALQQTKDKRAEKAAEASTEKECKRYGGTWADGTCTPKSNDKKAGKTDAKNKKECEKNKGKWENNECIVADEETVAQNTRMTEEEKTKCRESGGEPFINQASGNEICKCGQETYSDSRNYKTCKKEGNQTPTTMTDEEKTACTNSGGEIGTNPTTQNEVCKCDPRKSLNDDVQWRTCKRIDNQSPATPTPSATHSQSGANNTPGAGSGVAAAGGAAAAANPDANSKPVKPSEQNQTATNGVTDTKPESTGTAAQKSAENTTETTDGPTEEEKSRQRAKCKETTGDGGAKLKIVRSGIKFTLTCECNRSDYTYNKEKNTCESASNKELCESSGGQIIDFKCECPLSKTFQINKCQYKNSEAKGCEESDGKWVKDSGKEQCECPNGKSWNQGKLKCSKR